MEIIKHYCWQIVLIIIVFLPFDVIVRGAILLLIWTCYCTAQLIINRKKAIKYYHYEERHRRNKDVMNLFSKFRDNL